MESTKLIFVKLVHMKTTFPQNLLVNEQTTTNFCLHLIHHGQLHACTYYYQGNKLVLVIIIILGSKAFYCYIKLNYYHKTFFLRN